MLANGLVFIELGENEHNKYKKRLSNRKDKSFMIKMVMSMHVKKICILIYLHSKRQLPRELKKRRPKKVINKIIMNTILVILIKVEVNHTEVIIKVVEQGRRQLRNRKWLVIYTKTVEGLCKISIIG